ncbi:ATPase family AAA domain-containing protein 5 [Tupaia chinensis]|uniref:ATPase family AAA domain-containing protein 5 n=1 Tax=Tupaia chinensis TaxID=246437 RepID=L9KGH4_TUPCH|nr:ATPase family AAA domain-containing protein 5 [Tupaia chinensis]
MRNESESPIEINSDDSKEGSSLSNDFVDDSTSVLLDKKDVEVLAESIQDFKSHSSTMTTQKNRKKANPKEGTTKSDQKKLRKRKHTDVIDLTENLPLAKGVNLKKGGKDVKQIIPSLTNEIDSTTNDANARANVTETARLTESTITVSYEEFLKSHKENKVEQIPDSTMSICVPSETAEDIVKSDDISDTENCEISQQVRFKTVTVLAQVHPIPPKKTGKIPPIFLRQKPCEMESSLSDPENEQTVQKRKSNVVIQEEELELAVLEAGNSEAVKPKCTLEERQQFMKAFRQPASEAPKTVVKKSSDKQKDLNEKILNEEGKDSSKKIMENTNIQIVSNNGNSQPHADKGRFSKEKNKKQKKKGKVKVAPLFLAKNAQKTADPNLGFDESSQDTSGKSQDYDIEFKAKRDFLMSGLPDLLKRQITKKAAALDAYNAVSTSFQTVVHVQQKNDGCHLWHLKPPSCPLLTKFKELNTKLIDFSKRVIALGEFSTLNSNLKSTTPANVFMRTRKDFTEEIRNILLEEIGWSNPEFALRKYFPLLLKKRVEYQVLSECHGNQGSPQLQPDVNQKETKRKRVETENHKSKRKKTNGYSENSKKINGKPEEHDERNSSSEIKLDSSKDSGIEDMLWTEKYQPQNASELIGNELAIKKLHSWLKDWKRRAELEERQNLKGRRDEKQEDLSDSIDFKGSSDDEEGRLCNTVLITGPTGVGKTAAVYACAQELGFKIFEVNASSQRSGRQILSQLKEATQSHQVDKQGVNSQKPCFFNSYSIGKSPKKLNSPKKLVISPRKFPPSPKSSGLKRTLPPKTLANYFKVSSKPKNNEEIGTLLESNKGTKNSFEKKQITQTESTSITNSNVKEFGIEESNRKNATSLILFEEVDVIFDEDAGFLNAIKTFMATTKRPVILTTNDPTFSLMFDGCFEEINFNTPSLHKITTKEEWHKLIQLLTEFQMQNVDFLYSNLEFILPIPVDILPETKNLCGSLVTVDASAATKSMKCLTRKPSGEQPLRKSQKKKHKKKMVTLDDSDLFDTELHFPPEVISLSPELSSSNSEERTDKDNEHNPETKNLNQCLDPNSESVSPLPKTPAEKKCSALVSHCLNSLTEFMDNMSFLDALVTDIREQKEFGKNDFSWTNGKVKSGLCDEFSLENSDGWTSQSSAELKAATEALSFTKCSSTISKALESSLNACKRLGRDPTSDLTFHVSQKRNDVYFSQSTANLDNALKRVAVIKSVFSSRSLLNLGNRQASITEYLPTLRNICRTEKLKEQGKSKRRFLHYFEGIHLDIPKETMNTLAADFP